MRRRDRRRRREEGIDDRILAEVNWAEVDGPTAVSDVEGHVVPVGFAETSGEAGEHVEVYLPGDVEAERGDLT